MHVEFRGSGPPLVLLHGWAMHGGIFAPLRVRLEAFFSVHCVDLPGHGYSRARPGPLEPAACAAALAKAVPADAVWCGWSLGGLVALAAAAAGRTRGLAMLCASPRFTAAQDWPGVDPEVLREFGRGLGADHRATVDRFLALEAMGSAQMREDLRELRQHVFDRGEPAPAALSDGLAVLEGSDLRAALPQLPCPSLWIAGRRDRLVPWQAVAAAAAAAPRARLVRIDEAGHAPQLSHGDAIASELRRFAAELPA